MGAVGTKGAELISTLAPTKKSEMPSYKNGNWLAWQQCYADLHIFTDQQCYADLHIFTDRGCKAILF